MKIDQHFVLFSVLLLGCGKPLVGAYCHTGYIQQGNTCVVDPNANPDGGGGDGGMNGDGSDDGGTDVIVSCGLGQVECNGVCIDPLTDPNHCGGCVPDEGGMGEVCDSGEFCANGSCSTECDPPLVLCGQFCVDTTGNPDHCGPSCEVCSSGICEGSVCADARFGHVVVIGHDYRSYSPNRSINVLVGNAVFLNAGVLPSGQQVRVLSYQDHTLQDSITGTPLAIGEHPAATSRGWDETIESNPSNISGALAQADVFLIYAQNDTDIDDITLSNYGTMWSTALTQFVGTGHVIVLLDAGSSSHTGTFQLLSPASLFNATGVQNIDTNELLHTIAGSDQIAQNLSAQFTAQNQTVYFENISTPNTVTVVNYQSLDPAVPAVTHLAIPPP